MKTWICAALLLPISAVAQYKCVVDGHTTYAELPCGPGATDIRLNVPAVTEKQRLESIQSVLKQQVYVIKAIGRNGADRTHESAMRALSHEREVTEAQQKKVFLK